MKRAFTMIELVFVIVVIGILAAVIIPSTRTNPVQEAAVKLLSDIRYTQHLSMVDDKYGDNGGGVSWYEKRWQIVFNANQYSISNIDSLGNTDFAENPSNPANDLGNIDLGTKYGITITLEDDCSGETIISFDHLGRLMVGSLATGSAYTVGQLISGKECNIKLSNSTESATINIQPETGYASITF